MPALLAVPATTSSTSRIPRTRTKKAVAARPDSGTDNDENSEPPTRRGASLAGKNAGETTKANRRVVFATIATVNQETVVPPMPTPPNSQSPPRKRGSKAVAKTVEPAQPGPASAKPSKLPRARPQAGSSNTAASGSGTAIPASAKPRRAPSRSPIPAGPSHAPHVLAARRRASVSPLPATSNTPAPAPATSSTSSDISTKKPRQPRKKVVRPRPSELLPVPIGSPPPSSQYPGGLGADEDDSEADELLLLPPEMTRGRGEGKVRPAHHQHRYLARAGSVSASQQTSFSMRRSTSREVVGSSSKPASQESLQSVKSEDSNAASGAYFAADGADPRQAAPGMSFSITAPSSDAALGDADPFGEIGDAATATDDQRPQDDALAAEREDEADLGGFDGHDYFEPDDDDHQAGASPRLVAAAELDEFAGEQEANEDGMGLEAGPQFADLEDPSSGSEIGGDDHPEGGLDEDVVGRADEAETLGEALIISNLGEAEQGPGGTVTDVVTAELDDPDSLTDEDELALNSSSYELPAHSARRSRPSYPPLSPTRTGEVDDVVSVRMESSSPEPQPQPHLEADLELQARKENDSEEQPQVEEAEDVFGSASAQDTSAENIKPSIGTLVGAVSPRPFPLHGTPSAAVLPALLRPSAFFPAATRSPSPAAFGSPNPLPSPAARPTLQFASPRLPRERFASMAPSLAAQSTDARTPASTSFAPDLSPAKTWTRGPAFFRSSSFSPPAHAALPKTATLFERHPGGRGARQRARGEAGMAEQSREYQPGAGLDTSSPSQSQEAASLSMQEQLEGSEASDDDEEEDEVILVGEESQALERAKSRSLSPASSTPSAAKGASHLSPQKDGTLSDPASESDRDLHSPARSVNGDIRMGSPSPRQSTSTERNRPATPRESAGEGGETDCRMASPSPARSEYSKAQGSPLRARFGEFVEGSKSRIQGLLFGSPQKAPVSQSSDATAPTDQGHEHRRESEAEGVEAEDEVDEAEQPFADPKLHPPRGPNSVADSTFSLSRSMASFTSSNTSRRSRRRSRPSHPTLPVIEISSTDAHAAARAAAILKVYHKYVEQGVEAVDLERLVAAEQAGVAFDRSVAAGDVPQAGEDDEEEEELRTLLLDAEDEVREMVPRQPSVLANDVLAGLDQSRVAATPEAEAPALAWTSREWRRLEQALVEVGRKRHRANSVASAASTSMSMTSDMIAAASVTGEDVEPDEVIEAFLRKWRISNDALQAEWSWDKLVIRVEALKARRAKDARTRRASTGDSARTAPAIASRRQARELSAVQEFTEEPDAASDAEESEAEVDDLVKLESSDEADADALTPIDERSFAETSSSSSDEGEGANDETFFASERRYRRRRSSIEPVHQPTALANPALRHLYDATPAPEKPQLPFNGISRAAQPAAEVEDEIDQSDSESPSAGTPEPLASVEEAGRSPSSASRLLLYLGSFVRRSPAVSPSSTRAASRSTPESPSGPEMQQVQRGDVSITPLNFANTSASFIAGPSKPLPPISDRKILPLPPSHTTANATLHVAVDEPSFDTSQTGNTTSALSSFVPLAFRRRRRSSNSGERSLVWDIVNAIEEAESSREEEEARIVDLLQNSTGSLTGAVGTKRRAAAGDLRGGDAKGKGKAVDWRGYVEIDRELERGFLATGLRATDRRVSGEKRATRR